MTMITKELAPAPTTNQALGDTFPVTVPPLLFNLPTGRYARRMHDALQAASADASTLEGIAQEEAELAALIHNLNATRKRSGAEPLF